MDGTDDMAGPVAHTQMAECRLHGATRAAYACRHLSAALTDRMPRGVHFVTDDDGCTNAWCDRCNDFLAAHGGEWNDETEAFAGIRLLCEGCFDELKTFNSVKDWN